MAASNYCEIIEPPVLEMCSCRLQASTGAGTAASLTPKPWLSSASATLQCNRPLDLLLNGWLGMSLHTPKDMCQCSLDLTDLLER